jgi:hypothetical protein
MFDVRDARVSTDDEASVHIHGRSDDHGASRAARPSARVQAEKCRSSSTRDRCRQKLGCAMSLSMTGPRSRFSGTGRSVELRFFTAWRDRRYRFLIAEAAPDRPATASNGHDEHVPMTARR